MINRSDEHRLVLQELKYRPKKQQQTAQDFFMSNIWQKKILYIEIKHFTSQHSLSL